MEFNTQKLQRVMHYNVTNGWNNFIPLYDPVTFKYFHVILDFLIHQNRKQKPSSADR